MRLKFLQPLALCLALLCGACSQADSVEEPDVDQDLAYCHQQVLRTLSELKGDSAINYSLMPRNVEAGSSSWHCRPAVKEEWCSGFWPGVLWYDYEATGDSVVLREAERFTRALEPLAYAPAYDHDLGFLIYCSYGNAYRLTGKEEYRRAILSAADSLAQLFVPKVGTILSWPRNVSLFGGYNTIMDNMMNLEMLFWAAENGGSSRLKEIAVSHADHTMRDFFRPDFTSCHVAVYDTLSGKLLRTCTHQGYADSSMWARGQAWAIYGFTMVYRETGDRKYLDFVQKVADAYLKELPADGIPPWDFQATEPAGRPVPRDASAACVVASALLELETYVDSAKAEEYHAAACRMLRSLAGPEYRSGKRNPSFLMHSTGNYPAGSEIDASIIYADYYYIEALLRLKNLER